MKIIHDYLDSLFLQVPKTLETEKAKNDLLAIMEDHYQELIDAGKSEHEAVGTVISEFGSIDEILQELELEKEQPEKPKWQENEIVLDEAFHFWDRVRNFALHLSLGICFCILAAAFLAIFASRFSAALGWLSAIVLLAIGVGLIIMSSLSYSSEKKKLNDRLISTEVRKEAARQQHLYDKSFRVGLVIGICCCILSIFPIVTTAIIFYIQPSYAMGLFFFMIAIGVFFIVYSSIIQQNFKRFAGNEIFISDEDEPGPNAREYMYGDSATTSYFIDKVYWPLVTVVYLVFSFRFGGWAYSWIIYIIAGVAADVIKKFIRKNS